MQHRRPSAAECATGVLEGRDSVLSVLRYVERNPVRAGLVAKAAKWRWSSAWHRAKGAAETSSWLAAVPGGLPEDWAKLVNRPLTDAELGALRRCIRRGRPYGGDRWTETIVRRHGLESTLRPRGRPRKDGGEGV